VRSDCIRAHLESQIVPCNCIHHIASILKDLLEAAETPPDKKHEITRLRDMAGRAINGRVICNKADADRIYAEAKKTLGFDPYLTP